MLLTFKLEIGFIDYFLFEDIETELLFGIGQIFILAHILQLPCFNQVIDRLNGSISFIDSRRNVGWLNFKSLTLQTCVQEFPVCCCRFYVFTHQIEIEPKWNFRKLFLFKDAVQSAEYFLMSLEFQTKFLVFHHGFQSLHKRHVINTVEPNWSIEGKWSITNFTMSRIHDIFVRHIMSSIFPHKMRMVLIVPARVTVKNISNLGSAFCALLFTFPHNNEYSQVKISLETDDWFDILAMPARR